MTTITEIAKTQHATDTEATNFADYLACAEMAAEDLGINASGDITTEDAERIAEWLANV